MFVKQFPIWRPNLFVVLNCDPDLRRPDKNIFHSVWSFLNLSSLKISIVIFSVKGTRDEWEQEYFQDKPTIT